MSVSILIISHQNIGNAFLKTAKNTFDNKLPLTVSTVEVQAQSDPEQLISELQRLIKQIDHGDGVLILTDLFGSTPSNIAQKLNKANQTRIIAGLNLPMLLRVLNYPNLTLEELTEKAREGGQSGIIECET